MPFGTVSHRQHVVGKVGGFVPCGSQRYVQPDERLVGQYFDPGETVGISPHGVVHPGEVHVERAAAFLQEMWQQERQFVHGQRVLQRPCQRIPHVGMRRCVDRPGNELVPRIGVGAALGGYGPHQGVEQEQGAGNLPPALIPRGGAPPVVGGQPGARRGHDLGDVPQDRLVHTRLTGRVREGVVGIDLLQCYLEVLERRLEIRALGGQILLPVPPPADKFPVVPIALDQVVGQGQHDGRFRPGVRCHPVIGVGGRVRQAGVEHDEFGAVLFGFDDPLGVGIEIVPRFQMGRDQQHHLGIGEVGAGPVDAGPVVVAGPSIRRTHIGVGVVAVHSPGGENPFGVSVLAGAANVIHHLVVPLLLHRTTDAAGDIVQRFIPRHLAPLSLTPLAGAFERIENTIGVGDLRQRGRTLGAIAPT